MTTFSPSTAHFHLVTEGYSITAAAITLSLPAPGEWPVFDYIQPYYGPSHLRFNARPGRLTTLRWIHKSHSFLGFNLGPGPGISCAMGLQIFGRLPFCHRRCGLTRTGLPLYQAAETESAYQVHYVPVGNAVLFTYYNYNVPGVLVTVTRVAGSTGRATVNYQTVDGASLPIHCRHGCRLFCRYEYAYVGAVAGVDYVGVTNTLVFDDYEMSKTILIPILDRRHPTVRGATRITRFSEWYCQIPSLIR